MRKELPVRPNLEHLKSQAKDLLQAFRQREPEALRRFRESLPSARGVSDEELVATALALHDAQSVIAREYGCATWNDLRDQVAKSGPTPEMMRALMHPHLSLPLPAEVLEAAMLATGAVDSPPHDAPLPATLPLLPLRNAVLTVGAVAPLNIGRPSSLVAIAAANAGAKTIAVFAQRRDADESPTAADLHPIGCAAHLVSTVSTPDRGTWIVARGLRWIRLEGVEPTESGLVARISRFAVLEEDSAEVTRMDQLLRDQVRAFAARLPNGDVLLRMTERMTPLQLADVTIANVPCSVEEKARYACEPSLTKRLTALLALFDKAA